MGATLTISSGSHSVTLGDGPDPLYPQALAIVREDNKPSISYLQRKLQVGYNRAASILEEMEKAGIVSRMDSAGQRQIIG